LSPPISAFDHGNDQVAPASRRLKPLHRDRAQASGQDDRPSGSQDFLPIGRPLSPGRNTGKSNSRARPCPEEARRDPVTLGELIRWYIDTFASVSKWQRTKQTHLEFLERHAIGTAKALTLTAAMLINHVRSRRADGAGPATVMNDLVWIRVVLRAARNVKELPVRPEITHEARGACREVRLIAKPRRRARRPTAEELARLREYFSRRDRRARIPMQAVMDFAIASTRREAEICRLEWRDNEPQGRTGLVRDAKHPTAKDGNHRRFKYTAEAWAIVERQPRTSEYIFPYDPNSVGAAFTRACHVLGIEDLRFHDLRHYLPSLTMSGGARPRCGATAELPIVARGCLAGHPTWSSITGCSGSPVADHLA